MAGKGPVGDRKAAAADELDRTIREIRALVFSLAENRDERPAGRVPDRRTLPPG